MPSRPSPRITLMAGLAGTVAFPTAHGLATLFNWRETVLFFAAGTALITLPLTACALTCLQRQYRVNAPPKTREKIKVELNRKFALLAAAFMIVAIVHGMIITHLLPMLAERGVVPALAILTASLVGPMQVVGRLLMIATEGRTTTFTTAFACYFGMATGTAMLLLAGANQVMILSFVMLHGAAYGVTSIFRPILTREVLGETNFGLISGRIGGPFHVGHGHRAFWRRDDLAVCRLSDDACSGRRSFVERRLYAAGSHSPAVIIAPVRDGYPPRNSWPTLGFANRSSPLPAIATSPLTST